MYISEELRLIKKKRVKLILMETQITLQRHRYNNDR